MSARRLALLAILAGAAALAVYVTDAHYDQRDQQRAVIELRTHRFTADNRAHVEGYFGHAAPERKLRYVARGPGLLSDTIEIAVHLEGEPEPWRFQVTGEQVTPADERARALAERIRAWVAEQDRAAAPPSNGAAPK